ncbi:MAG: exosortase-associated EpsI family protein [Phycisphaerales bacterium]|nr:exosortase-associated EpsI family protein [Phycisphaerales bacterium]
MNDGRRSPFDRSARLALIVASLTLVVCGVTFQWVVQYYDVALRKRPVDVREQLSTISRRLGDWSARGSDRVIPDAVLEELGTEVYLDRVCVLDDDAGGREAINLHIAYYTGLIDAVPHVPDRCFVAGGGATIIGQPENVPLPVDGAAWPVTDPPLLNLATGRPYRFMTYAHPVTGRTITVHMPLNDLELRTSVFRPKDDPEARLFAGYLFIANGRTTCRPEDIRLLAFDLRDRYSYFCKVQFTMVGTRLTTKEQFVARASSLLEPLLPELMRCLPDWAEVERRDASTSPGSPATEHGD